MKAKHIGTCCMVGGLLLAAAALWFAVGNLREEQEAAHKSSAALQEILAEVKPTTGPTFPATGPAEPRPEDPTRPTIPAIPEYMRDPQIPMPTMPIGEYAYVGIVEIPALNLFLPVIDQWSYPALKVAPCRYRGSAYLDDLVIMAHNYACFFGSLVDIQIGDAVYFTDMQDHVFAYEVVELEALDRLDVEQMIGGDWDLTLFTCTIDGMTRVTVRCQRT